jgi:hypothetical protein
LYTRRNAHLREKICRQRAGACVSLSQEFSESPSWTDGPTAGRREDFDHVTIQTTPLRPISTNILQIAILQIAFCKLSAAFAARSVSGGRDDR